MDRIRRYFPELTEDMLCQIELFCQWIISKNRSINLISRKSEAELIPAHILPSLCMGVLSRFRAGERVLDIGTGGGFPGIILSIMCPNVSFTLVDSIGKKMRAIEELVTLLRLTHVTCYCARVESLHGVFDSVTGRAVTNWLQFQQLAYPHIKKHGRILYLTGGDVEVDKYTKVHDLHQFFGGQYCETKVLLEKIVNN